jgi:hypothetical protein
MMSIREATTAYESWLGERITLVKPDLKRKHDNMKTDPFIFMRATFYRWAQVFPATCRKANSAPQVVAVGDLHLENFGTWRDADGRLVWGVNDFDEAYTLPYTNDLIRLAASLVLGLETDKLAISLEEGCRKILEGYSSGIETGGEPFVLEEKHAELREMATGVLRSPKHYWAKIDTLKPAPRPLPASAQEAIGYCMTGLAKDYSVLERQAGEGSLGRQRYLARAHWCGGAIAREIKALALSACIWSHPGRGELDNLYQFLLTNAVRCPDPFVQIRGQWVIRRLAPHCSRIELAALPKERDEKVLLHAMGYETANIHLGTRGMKGAIQADLRSRARANEDWLVAAAQTMAESIREDWQAWKGRDSNRNRRKPH